jgi:predicted DNA binding CopG/RHH family protein
MKKKMGRPRLPQGEKKKVFSLRLSPEELKAIESKASEAGQKVTEWARARLLNG